MSEFAIGDNVLYNYYLNRGQGKNNYASSPFAQKSKASIFLSNEKGKINQKSGSGNDSAGIMAKNLKIPFIEPNAIYG